MSIGRWLDKEVMIHNRVLLSHKKECIWVSSNEVDETEAYYTQWSKSERQTPYINAYIWNLERWYQQSYVQGSKGGTGKQTLGLSGRRRGMIWEKSIETYTSPYVKQMTGASLMHEAGHQKPCSGTTWRDGVGMGGTHVHLWQIYVDVWQKPSQYCKAIILQFK